MTFLFIYLLKLISNRLLDGTKSFLKRDCFFYDTCNFMERQNTVVGELDEGITFDLDQLHRISLEVGRLNRRNAIRLAVTKHRLDS